MSLQKAISYTWTGNHASKYGFSSARVTEAIRNSGAMGSVIGEMMGKAKDLTVYDETIESLEPEATLNDFVLRLNELILKGADTTKLSAAVSAFVFGLDPSIASDYANIAYVFNATSDTRQEKHYRFIGEHGETVFSGTYSNTGAEGLTRIEGSLEAGFNYTLLEEEQEWLARLAAMDEAQAEANRQRLIEDSLACISDTSKCQVNLYGSGFEPPPVVEGGLLFDDYMMAQDHFRAQLNQLVIMGKVVDGTLDIACSIIGACEIYATVQSYNNGEATKTDVVFTVGMAVVTGGVGSKVIKRVAKGTFQVGKSLGAAATRISVRGGSHLAEGSKVTNIRKIADGREIREVGRLVEQYGGKAKSWLKRSGDANVVTTSGNVRRAEVHWYEAHGVGKVEFKVKTWLD